MRTKDILGKVQEELNSLTNSIVENQIKLNEILKKQDARLTRGEDNISALCYSEFGTDYVGVNGFMQLNLTGEEVSFTINFRTEKIVYQKDAITVYFLGRDGNKETKYTSLSELTEAEKKMYDKYNCVYIGLQ